MSGNIYFCVADTIYSYNPLAPISNMINPKVIATTCQSYCMLADSANSTLYIGGMFSSVNTVSEGYIIASNVIAYNPQSTTTGIVNMNLRNKGGYAYQEDGALHIILNKSEQVQVYDMLGNLVYTSTGQYHNIPVVPGVYVVRTKEYIYKVAP